MSNVREKLEEAVMNDSVDLSQHNIYSHPNDWSVDGMIDLLVSLPKRDLTFGEIIALTDDWSSEYSQVLTKAELYALEALYSHWVDKEALVNRSDNYLSNNYDTGDWKSGYNSALAEYVISNGYMTKVDPDFYGWEDYNNDFGTEKYPKSQIIGAYNTKEQYWNEFAGTFVDADEKIGVEVDVLYSNGYSRKLRVEKSMAEIINHITK